MAIAHGSCGQCEKLLLVLKWIGGKLKVIVMCPDCDEEMQYDLQALQDACGSEEIIIPWDGKVH